MAVLSIPLSMVPGDRRMANVDQLLFLFFFKEYLRKNRHVNRTPVEDKLGSTEGQIHWHNAEHQQKDVSMAFVKESSSTQIP